MGRLTDLVLERPRAALIVILAVTIVLGSGLTRIRTDAGFRAYVGDDHPAVLELDSFVARFGGGLPILAVWSCDDNPHCSDVFDPDPLLMAFAVATAMAQVEGVIAVESPATSSLLIGGSDGLEVRNLVEDGTVAPDVALLKPLAIRDPLWAKNIVGRNGAIGAIVVELASSDSDVNVRAVRALLSSLEPHQARGYQFHLVGDPVQFVVAGEALKSDSIKLVPVIVGVIGSIVILLFRSWLAAVLSLATVGIAVIWAIGMMGWLGWPQTAVSQALAPFILVVGVCNVIHLLSRYAAESLADAGTSARPQDLALREAAADVGPGCAVASVTTAAGFLSFATSGAISFSRFGFIAAIGVLSGLALSFSLLPVLISRTRLDLANPRPTDSWESALGVIVAVAQNRRRLVLAGSLVVSLVCLMGIGSLQVETDVYHMFGEKNSVVRSIRFVEENLRGKSSLEISLEIPRSDDAFSPTVIDAMTKFESRVLEIDGFVDAASFVDVLSFARRLLRGDVVDTSDRSETHEANAQILFLVSMHDSEALARWISFDQRTLRLSLESDVERYTDSAAILERVRAIAGETLPRDWKVAVTGPLAARFYMVDEVQKTQLRSFGTALLVVFAVVAAVLGSMRWAAVAMIPTMMPVILTLGAMGFWGIYLDMGTAMVAAVVLGIAIDDTVHLLLQYRRRLKRGIAPQRAMSEAVRHVGRAVVTTSISLSLGFFVLTLSSWESVASFGFLSGMAILGAMLADLIVLPAVVSSVDSLGRSQLR